MAESRLANGLVGVNELFARLFGYVPRRSAG